MGNSFTTETRQSFQSNNFSESLRQEFCSDRLTKLVVEFLDNMPVVTTCEIQLTASLNGYRIPACREKAVVCDLESEHEHCLEHYLEYRRGRFEPR